MTLFDEAEMEQDFSIPEDEMPVKEHTRKKKSTHADMFKGLKVNRIVLPLTEEEQICPVCGTQMELIGEEYVRRELVFVPAKCEINEYYSQNYSCPFCKEGKGDTEKAVIVKSKVPSALVGKDLHHLLLLHGRCIRSMQTVCPCTARKKTGSSMVLKSAGPHLQTGSFTAHSIIFSLCMTTSTGNC